MECPTSTTGTDPNSATTASSASFRSPTGEASAPFQPRTRKRWSRVTTEAYPYGSGMTGIGAAFLAPERLSERGLSPSSLTYAPTGERVASASRLRELRATDPGGLVIIDLLNEDDPADRALQMRSLTFPG